MFLISFIRMLLSLPFLWGGQLTGMFQMPISISLLKVAWWISADGETGFKALVARSKHGSSIEAIGCAVAWMEKYPRVELAAYAGLLAAAEGMEDVARDMLGRCQQFPPDKLGLTELLELSIAQRFEPHGASIACARRLEDRNDLSAAVSGMIHTELLWDDMLGKRFEASARRAKFMLSVGDSPMAHVVLAALAKCHGDLAGISHHRDQAKLPPAELHYYSFLASVGIDDDEGAREHLASLRDLNVSLAGHAINMAHAAGESQ
ncbi:MAG: hypothetical protein GY794_02575 [bacterium]|nr:hypothetical protein [bacterium]